MHGDGSKELRRLKQELQKTEATMNVPHENTWNQLLLETAVAAEALANPRKAACAMLKHSDPSHLYTCPYSGYTCSYTHCTDTPVALLSCQHNTK